jgi:hypothetical protein
MAVTHWWYNTETGQMTRSNILTQSLQVFGSIFHIPTAGWHELHIDGGASEAQAAAEAKREFPQGAPPTTAAITPGRVLSTAAQEGNIAAGDWLSGLTKWIGQQSIWVRVAEIAAGMMILYIGLKAVTAPDGASARSIGKSSVKSTAKNVRRIVTKV